VAAAAETAEESEAGLAEVVVTAQRREESLQKTSLALQVVSGEEMKNAGITDVGSLETLVPGLQIGMAGATPQVYIRGVGDFGATPITNPAVALNADGVYIAKVLASGGSMFDLERVEVLKGPQGTLYGRNASGGAINFISKKPVLDSLGGYADVEGGNYGLVTGEAAINLPITSEFALRVAGQATSRRGYMSLGESDDHHRGARILGLWRNDALSLLVGIDYAHLGGEGGGYALINPGIAGVSDRWTANNDPRFTSVYYQAAAIQGLCIPAPLFPTVNNPGACPAVAPYPSPPFPAGLSGPYTSLVTAQTQRPWQDDNLWRYHAELVAELGGGTQLTVLPAFQSATLHNLVVTGQLAYQPNEDSHASSLEVRLSNNSPRLKWVGGLYYFDQKDDSNEFVTSGLVQNNAPITTQKTHAGAVEPATRATSATSMVRSRRYRRVSPSCRCPEIPVSQGCQIAVCSRRTADRTLSTSSPGRSALSTISPLRTCSTRLPAPASRPVASIRARRRCPVARRRRSSGRRHSPRSSSARATASSTIDCSSISRPSIGSTRITRNPT
jgi:iron complex outermembrane recepter protein